MESAHSVHLLSVRLGTAGCVRAVGWAAWGAEGGGGLHLVPRTVSCRVVVSG